MKNLLGVIFLLAVSSAHADTMSFQLENANGIEGNLTLSGSGITINQTSYNSGTLSNYEIDLSFDYGNGLIEFEMTGGDFNLTSSSSNPTAYYGWNGVNLQLSETTTNPGQVTDWTFTQYVDVFPGNENDDILILHNLATNEAYGDSYPSAGPHTWRLIPSPVPTIDIDVLTGDTGNNIDPDANVLLDVGILTTSIADQDDIDFNASQVDTVTLSFGPQQTEHTGTLASTDIDDDGDLDLIVEFDNLSAGFLCEDNQAVLEGRTLTGEYFVGTDTISTPECDSKLCHADPQPSRDTSRNPEWVVFLASDPDGNANQQHLYAAADNDSTLLQLSENPAEGYNGQDVVDFIISPDGQWVAYVQLFHWNLELFVSAIDGSSRVQVSDAQGNSGAVVAGYYKWSPDSSKLAFTINSNDDRELFIANRDGTNHTKINNPLPEGGDIGTIFDWSPDSTRIAYTGDQTTNGQSEIWIASADGSSKLKVSTPPVPSGIYAGPPTWLPDGSRVVYWGTLLHPGEGNLYSVKPDGTDHQTLSGPMVSGGDIYGYSGILQPISGDSSHVIYTADQETLGTNELFVSSTTGTGNTKVNELMAAGKGVGCCNDLSWSPDGQSLLYRAQFAGTDFSKAYMWNKNTGVSTELSGTIGTSIVQNTAWSPDGSKLAYQSDHLSKVGYQKLHIANSDGTGDFVASGVMSSGGTISGSSYNVASKRFYPKGWSPDSSMYMYVASKNFSGIKELFISAADGSYNRKVSNPLPSGTGIHRLGYVWSRDGKKVAYLQEINGVFSLYSNDSVGGTPKKISQGLTVTIPATGYAGPSY